MRAKERSNWWLPPTPSTSHDFGDTGEHWRGFRSRAVPTVSSGLRGFSTFKMPHRHGHRHLQEIVLAALSPVWRCGRLFSPFLVLSLPAQRSQKEGCNGDKLSRGFSVLHCCCLHLSVTYSVSVSCSQAPLGYMRQQINSVTNDLKQSLGMNKKKQKSLSRVGSGF